jgi:protein-S-isoprenylcysteine O-methyltransferase Ste14
MGASGVRIPRALGARRRGGNRRRAGERDRRAAVPPRAHHGQPAAASSLVTGGIYRWTRNPMYLGMALALAGWGLYLGNFGALALVGLFVMYIDRYQIDPEERALTARFGDAFAAYRRRVRRWL